MTVETWARAGGDPPWLAALRAAESDPRSQIRPPESVEEVAERYFPGWVVHRPRTPLNLLAGASLPFDLAVEAGACYAVVGLGDWVDTPASGESTEAPWWAMWAGLPSGVTSVERRRARLDVQLEGSVGIVTQDIKRDAWPAAMACAAQSETLRTLVSAPDDRARGHFLVVRDPDRYATRGSARDPFERLRAEAQRQIAGRATPWTEPQRMTFHRRGLRRLHVPLEARHCYAVTAYGLPSVEGIALAVTTEGGQRVEDREATPRAGVVLCPSAPGLAEVDVVVVRGYGMVEVSVLRLPTARRRD